MDKAILLISSHPTDEKLIREVASIVGLDAIVEPDCSKAVEYIANEKASVTFADADSLDKYTALENCLQERVGLFSDLIDSNTFNLMIDGDLGKADFLVQSPLMGSVVVRDEDEKDVPQNAAHLCRMIRGQIGSASSFEMSQLMSEKAKIQTIEFKNSKQKQEGVEAVKNYLLAAKFKGRMATVIANAVDELLMNAMFDAPIDEIGKHIYSSVSRSTELKLEGKAAVKMNVGFDGSYVGIGVTDYFGSLDKAKLLTHISKRYKNEEYKVKSSVAGAGIGLATVFRSGGSLLFRSENRVQTDVAVFFKRTDNYREFRDQFRFLSTHFVF